MDEKLIWGETCGISPNDPEYDAFMDRFENDAPLDQRDAKLMLAYQQFQLAAAQARIAELEEQLRKQAPTHSISACYFPEKEEAELTWENLELGETLMITTKVSPKQGKALSDLVWPCVYHPATIVSPAESTLARLREVVPEAPGADEWCQECGQYVVGDFRYANVDGKCPDCGSTVDNDLDPVRAILYPKEQSNE